MADDAARHIAGQTLQTVARHRTNNVAGLTDRRVAIETRTARLKLAAAVAARSPGQSHRSGWRLSERAPVDLTRDVHAPASVQARCRIEADPAAAGSAGLDEHQQPG